MSLLIKGMEMPKEGTVIAIYKLDGKFFASVHGTELCPLIPVPPHGDLIDRKVLMRHKGDCYDADGHLLYAVGTGNILRAPTIIPASEEGEK